MRGRTTFVLLAFFLVLGSEGKVVPEKADSPSGEIRIQETFSTISPSSSFISPSEEEQKEEKRPSVQPLAGRETNNTEVRFRRDGFTGEINNMDWHTILDSRAVNLGWLGDGDVYDIIVYSGYPVGGGPGLPVYRNIRGITGNRYEIRGLKQNSDYLVHIRARKYDGRTGPYFSFEKVTPGN